VLGGRMGYLSSGGAPQGPWRRAARAVRMRGREATGGRMTTSGRPSVVWHIPVRGPLEFPGAPEDAVADGAEPRLVVQLCWSAAGCR
jgi:hypothetical protein